MQENQYNLVLIVFKVQRAKISLSMVSQFKYYEVSISKHLVNDPATPTVAFSTT